MTRPRGCRASNPPESPSPAPGDPSDDTTVAAAGRPAAFASLRDSRRPVARRAVAAFLLCSVALLAPTWANAQTAPTVSSVTPVSDPGADDTYGLGDTITVAVEFTAAVTVFGVPQITLRVGGGAAVNLKLANYASGSGTTTLRFSYVVQAADMDTNGIYLEANELVLNGGTIQSADGVAAVLTYPAEGQQNGHKVDGSIADTTPPALESATVAADGTSIDLVFDEPYDLLALPAAASNPFSVTADGSTVTVGEHVVLPDEGITPSVYRTIQLKELSSVITSGQVVTVSYTDPTPGDDTTAVIQDAVGNDAETFTQTVTNRSTVTDTSEGTVATDRAALVALYNTTGGANWTNNTNWLTNEALSEWYGVTTNSDGRVTSLDLNSNQLTGPIPAELGNLASLQELILWYNQLTGPIPAALGDLTELRELSLSRNMLDGEIPAALGDLASLQILYLNDNKLTGPIPGELGNLSSLQKLHLSRNMLDGEIPAELGDLASLQEAVSPRQ